MAIVLAGATIGGGAISKVMEIFRRAGVRIPREGLRTPRMRGANLGVSLEVLARVSVGGHGTKRDLSSAKTTMLGRPF